VFSGDVRPYAIAEDVVVVFDVRDFVDDVRV
jgi:hypothetical protein